MYKKILVPMALDHDISPQTLAIAETLCAKGGEIIALHVQEALQGSVAAYLDEETIEAGRENTRKLMAEKTASRPNLTAQIVTGHSARTIVDYAKANGIDCIVMGSHKPGITDYFIGGTASRVVRHAACAVHVHRPTD